MSLLRAAVIGVGHLGSQHARIYHQLSDVQLVAVIDVVPEWAQRIAQQYRIPFFTDYREVLQGVDLVSIATPTVWHHEIAKEFLQRGIPCLVEKPLAMTLQQAQELVEIAGSKGTILQVGHVERFNPALIAVDELIRGSSPRFIESHRLSPFRFRSADIDVLMDLMIHDIDIILYLVDSDIHRIDAIGGALLSANIDIANARLEFQNGCVANVTASRISENTMRKMRIFTDHSYISLDFLQQSAKIYRPSNWVTWDRSYADPLSDTPRDFYKIEQPQVERVEPLARELREFVDAVRDKRAPVVPGEHGVRAIRVAQLVLEQIKGHTWA